MRKIGMALTALILFLSCNNASENKLAQLETVLEDTTTTPNSTLSKGDEMIAKAIEAHGGALYNQADYAFVFRKKEYRFINNDESFNYEMQTTDRSGNRIKDVIVNGAFTRYINDQPVTLSEKNIKKYEEALNSVIYFATLPYKLNDGAVNKEYEGTTTIKGINYNVVKVFFNQEGGGTDHDDTYYYWINTQTNLIDFLAYNYTVNGGGARFRSFYNRRNVEGITFQDYINWKVPVNKPLSSASALYEKDELKELSRIITEQVQKN